MSDGQVKSVVVVGGGTAGWLSACILAKQLQDSVKVTLVESPTVPVIGVGEGTVPTMRHTLKLIGISETEFVRECSATFKQAIEFVDWLHNPAERSHRYYHLFNYPQWPGFDTTPYWLLHGRNSFPSYADTISIQVELCRLGKAPKKITQREFEASAEYAYHLDALKFAQLLAKHGVKNLGISHVHADVTTVDCDEDGTITCLQLNDRPPLQGDFFVDCSGFASVLLAQKLNVKFIEKHQQLFVDHAVAMQVPYATEQHPIASATLATAREAGWIWDIGLQQRRGIGYVYSSQYTSHEAAEHTLRSYVGPIGETISARRIPMRVGYREHFWQKNCVAIGLSAGFIEPLEATAILLIEATAKLVAEVFPANKMAMPLAAKKVNTIVRYGWDRVFDFVKLHYHLTQRTDTDFWLDNRKPNSVSDALLEKLERWQYHPPSVADFPSLYEVFRLENYQYVLYGMEFQTNLTPIASRYTHLPNCLQHWKKLRIQAETLGRAMPLHRELIQQIHASGISSI